MTDENLKPQRGTPWNLYWADRTNHSWWETPAPEVTRLLQAADVRSYPRVLDLGCGLGRHAIALAQMGFSTRAVDASEVAVSHLTRWADGLSLSVVACVGEVYATPFPPSSFDLVISYNVIYHGRREQMVAVIEHVAQLLRPKGLFFFTCPSRKDGKYGVGTEVAPHAFLCEKSVTPGDLHYFCDESDLYQMTAGFRILNQNLDQGWWSNRGEAQFFSNWQVLAERR